MSGAQMLTINCAIICGFLFFSPCAYGQNSTLNRRISGFNSNGIGLTETLLRFSHQEHIPIAIEYVDRASLEKPMDVSLRNKTARQVIDSILANSNGYEWQLRNGIIEITNKHSSKRAKIQLNTVVPVFKIAEGASVQTASTMLWWDLQMMLDPSIKGFGGDIPGASSAVRPTNLENRTVREILNYLVLNSQAEGWIVAGPPECLGFTPHCGLWYMVEQPPFDSSYEIVLKKVRENL